MNEIWKSIGVFKGVDLTGYYEVSNYGRVKRLARIDASGHSLKEKILTSKPNRTGYAFISLMVNKKTVTSLVHQYVMNAFCPDHPPEKNKIRHIDGDKTNNKLDNLEWGTQSEVALSCSKRQAESLKKRVIPIVQLNADNGEFIKEHPLRESIIEFNGYNIAVSINKGKYFSNGYLWMYKPDYENMSHEDLMNIIQKNNEKKGNRYKDRMKPVLQLDEEGNIIQKYDSITKASMAVGCSKQAISICLKNPRIHHTAMGYVWKYENKEI